MKRSAHEPLREPTARFTERSSASFFMHRRCASLQPTQKGHLSVSFALVAEVGFEPHDLRVMSPTSYQAALLRDIKKIGAGNGNRTRTMLSHHGILSPGRLPIPPLRRFGFSTPIHYTTLFFFCQYILRKIFQKFYFCLFLI